MSVGRIRLDGSSAPVAHRLRDRQVATGSVGLRLAEPVKRLGTRVRVERPLEVLARRLPIAARERRPPFVESHRYISPALIIRHLPTAGTGGLTPGPSSQPPSKACPAASAT
jgi:hypothetical protein